MRKTGRTKEFLIDFILRIWQSYMKIPSYHMRSSGKQFQYYPFNIFYRKKKFLTTNLIRKGNKTFPRLKEVAIHANLVHVIIKVYHTARSHHKPILRFERTAGFSLFWHQYTIIDDRFRNLCT